MTTWGTRKTIGAVAVAAAIAGFGGSAIAAATSSESHGGFGGGGFGGMHGDGGPGGFSPPRGGAGGNGPAGGGDDAASLHGEDVVADGRGGYRTELSQTGRVTAISPTGVTARSDDGFVQTYVIREVGGAKPPPFAVGDRIVVDANREGEAAVVTTMRPPR